jgi:hypothetical protein
MFRDEIFAVLLKLAETFVVVTELDLQHLSSLFSSFGG